MTCTSTVKGGQKKMRPHETLTNANFKVLYRNKLYFLTTPEYFQDKNIELIQNTPFMDVKKIINNFPKKTFSVSEGAL